MSRQTHACSRRRIGDSLVGMDGAARQALQQAIEAYEHQRFDEAERIFRDLVGQGFHFADVYHMLGVICHAQGRLNEAQGAFERALELNPAYTEAALSLAVTYNDSGRYADAKRIYERTIARSEAAPQRFDPYARGKLANMHADIARAYEELGAWREAQHELEKATALCPDFPDLRVRLAELLRQDGALEKACEQLEHATQSRPDYLKAWLALGVTRLALGNKAGAQEAWNTVLAREPEHAAAKAYMRIAERYDAQEAAD